MQIKDIYIVSSVFPVVLVLAGCSSNGLPASAHENLSSHIDTSISPQQRIAKIQANPDLTAAQKTQYVNAIKTRNHLN